MNKFKALSNLIKISYVVIIVALIGVIGYLNYFMSFN